jgi:hypothetical protein
MQEIVEVNAEKVRPENDSEDALHKIQMQKANREKPANKPQNPTEGVLFDLDFFHTFSTDILLHGVTSKENQLCVDFGRLSHCRGVLSAQEIC